MEPTVITFQRPCPLMSMNARGHWRQRHRLTKAWRFATWAAAVQTLGPSPADRWRPPSIVAVVLPVSRGARRDPHNYFATVKPIVDGLVDAGVWPDDTPAFVRTVEPTFEVQHTSQIVTVTLTPINQETP